jgi:rSAM/selenodomain-associated transferase 2
MRISVVIPTLNEAAELPATIEKLRALPEILEIIVVDGGSTDETVKLALSLQCRVVYSPRGRGTQMRAGAQTAFGGAIVFLHADTWVRADFARAIIEALKDSRVVAGGCYKTFRAPSFLMRGSRARCWIRFHLLRRFMGDQAMFVRREMLERIGGVPDVPIMEEFELCRALRSHGQFALAGTVVSTSARRFRARGVLRTYVRMWRVTLQYYLGTPPEELRRIYEKE